MNKLLWITIANICSCLGVIILHANGVFWSFPSGSLWYTANFLETFFCWPVPLFFMITGATLIDYRKRYSTKEFFCKRIKKTLIPFIVWSVFSIFYRYQICGWQYSGGRDLINGIINTKFNSVYWFFIPLFAVYMSIPLLSTIDQKYRIKAFSYISLITFFFSSFLPTVFSLCKLEYNYAIQLPIAGGYILYVMLGYIIKNVDFKKSARYFSYFLAFIGWFLQFEGTNRLSLPAGEIIGTFRGYMNFPAVIQAVGVMIWFKYVPWDNILGKCGIKLVTEVSKYTFGIYLVNQYLIEQIPLITEINTNSFIYRTFGAVVIFAISAIICWIISKIPIINKSIGF